jgi:hypothetical protein
MKEEDYKRHRLVKELVSRYRRLVAEQETERLRERLGRPGKIDTGTVK